MTTPAMAVRIRPVLMTRMKKEIKDGRAKNKTEVIERSLCQYFSVPYEQKTERQNKGD